MFQKPKGFTQDCIVLLAEEGAQPLTMWTSTLDRPNAPAHVYRITQQWVEGNQVTEEYTLYLLKEELEQLLHAIKNYEAQGAQDAI